MSYVAHGCCSMDYEYFPTGHFIRAAAVYRHRELGENTYCRFFDEANELQDEWEPLRQGMFGGSYQEYKRLYDNAQKYYKANIQG